MTKAQLSHINIDLDGYTLFGDVASGGNYIELEFCGHDANFDDDRRNVLRLAEALDGRGCEISLDVARKHGRLMFSRTALGTQLERIIAAMCETLHTDGKEMTLTFGYAGKLYVFSERCSSWQRSGVWTYYVENPSSELLGRIQAFREVATARLERIEGVCKQALDITLHGDPEVCLANVIPLLAT